jgi:uncharacterized protein (DUF1778 family)
MKQKSIKKLKERTFRCEVLLTRTEKNLIEAASKKYQTRLNNFMRHYSLEIAERILNKGIAL